MFLPASGFNDQEFLVTERGLKKAGINIFIVSDAVGLCAGKNGTRVKPDVNFFNMRASNFSCMIFIGGSGVKKYWDNEQLHLAAKNFLKEKKFVAAICSAPVILARAGLLRERCATCYPADIKELKYACKEYKEEEIVSDNGIITARDANSAETFAQLIVNEINERKR